MSGVEVDGNACYMVKQSPVEENKSAAAGGRNASDSKEQQAGLGWPSPGGEATPTREGNMRVGDPCSAISDCVNTRSVRLFDYQTENIRRLLAFAFQCATLYFMMQSLKGLITKLTGPTAEVCK